jgi:hypothetical protein
MLASGAKVKSTSDIPDSSQLFESRSAGVLLVVWGDLCTEPLFLTLNSRFFQAVSY